ncbi:putative ribonuclease H-like domain-containing protein [Tanacetum coccineum]
MHLKHHEEQIEDILNYLDELSFHRIKKIKKGRINDRMIIRRNSDELKTKLERVRSQSIKLQRKQLGQRDKITFAHYRIFNLERIIKEIQARQEEGIDYDDVFAPVARIEAIRLFLAYASFIGFMVYQMDVKSDFLYGQIKEEVYVCQPPGFEDSDYPDKVYKVVKALYGLHQAPRAWYETLANYLLGNGFQRGKIDQTLFIKRQQGDILIVQVYVDDIIFGSTNKDKYVDEILKKFNYNDVKSFTTPVDLEKPLVKDGDADDVDVHLYRSMIGSLIYLTTSRPDIMFAVCACARFQVNPNISHLTAIKRIFKYLKGKPKLGLWYSRDSPFELVAYTDSDYARATQDRKSTTGGYLLTKGFNAGSLEFVLLLLGEVNTARLKVSTVRQTLEFCDKHNMVAYLLKTKGSENFHEIIDFLSGSHISYALTESPILYRSLIDQFWQTAILSTTEEGAQAITATVDDREIIISEASLRRHLKLKDSEGIPSLPNEEIFEQLTNMGYEITSDSLTFFKGHFSPQWKFFIHTILHCMSSKKIAWDQFSSNIATAIICLATNRVFNFSNFIFEGMVKNLNSTHKFLMYPRFIQIILNKYQGLLLSHIRTYPTPTLTNKLFNNMKRPTKGYSGVETPLFASMLVQPQGEASSTSISRISSSSYHSSEPSPSTTETQHFQPSSAEENILTPYDSPLYSVHSHGSDEDRLQLNELMDFVTKLSDRIGVLETDLQKTKKTYSSGFTKLILRVKKLEKQVKTGKARRRAKIVLSKDEDIADDSSKQGRKISDIDEDLNIFLAQDDGVEWVQEANTEVQIKASNETELVLQEVTPTEVVHDQGSSEKGQPKVSTSDISVSTAGVATGTAIETLIVSTTGVDISTASTICSIICSTTGRVVYRREVQSKKLLEQERLGFEEAIRLQQQVNEEEKVQIARDEEIVRQWYHALKKKPKTEAQARKNMIIFLKNQGRFKDNSNIEKEVMTRQGFNLQGESAKLIEEEVQREKVVAEQDAEKEPTKVSGKRKKSLARRKEASKK